MPVTDPFAGALRDESALRDLYALPEERALRKQIDRLDEMARRLVALSPLVVLGSHDAAGSADVSPRGGPPGFVAVLDDHHLAIPDASGNRRLDTARNVIATGRLGVLFVIPGRSQTLRVNGAACVTADPELLAALEPVGKPPRSALVVRAEEVFAHCPKAFVRARFWEPDTWPGPADQPSPAEVSHAHMGGDAFMPLAEVERQAEESLRSRLA